MAYKVKKGDTLGKIAAANDTTVAELMKLNPQIKNANLIQIGWSIALPGEKIPAKEKEADPIDPTKKKFKGRELMNVPGKPEVWHVGKTTFLVYVVPGTASDPVYMAWQATSVSDIQSWYGPDKKITFDRVLTAAQFKAMGVLDFGSTDEIPPGSDDPFASWSSTLDVQAQTQPWILDDDYQALLAQALVEGREITDAEIATTSWWKTHTKAERQWMITYHGDPQTAADIKADNRARVRQMVIDAGGTAQQGVLNFLGDQFTGGRWTLEYLNGQIKAITDPYSGIKVDPELAARTGFDKITQTQAEEDTVRELLHTWLGPSFGKWSQSEIARQAGLIRNDPDALANFEEQLKTQRMALFPMYTDRETSYAAIANTWRQWWLGQWGEMPDEGDNLFMQVMKNNDTEVSGQLLRREGLNRGVAKVTQSLSEQSVSRLGDSERNPVNA